METVKWKLANSILTEVEGLKECTSITGIIALAELITMDAEHLAEIIKEEEEFMEQQERKVA